MARKSIRKASSRKLTRDDVMNYKVDWKEWHDIVAESLHAFDFDGVAYVANKLDIVCEGWDKDERFPIKGFDLSMEVEQTCRFLIAMYELGWDEPSENAEGVSVFDGIILAWKLYNRLGGGKKRLSKKSSSPTDGIYHAYLKFRPPSNDENKEIPIWLIEPHIEIKLVIDDDANPWFQIDFNVISQSF